VQVGAIEDVADVEFHGSSPLGPGWGAMGPLFKECGLPWPLTCPRSISSSGPCVAPCGPNAFLPNFEMEYRSTTSSTYFCEIRVRRVRLKVASFMSAWPLQSA